MKFHLFLILCIVKTSFSRSSRKNEAKLEGNALIERILNAERFNELADKIVDKALEKLKHETSLTSSDSIKNNTPLEPNSVRNNLRQSKKGHKSKVAKIDVDAVLRKKVIPFNDLLFRYDHFTKNPDTSHKKTHSKTNNNDKKKRQKTNYGDAEENAVKKATKEKPKLNSNEQSEKDISKSQEKSDSKKSKQTDLSSENMTFNNKGQNESAEIRFGDEKLIIWGNSDKKSEETVDLDKSIENKPMRQKKGLNLKRTTDMLIRALSIEQDIASNEDNDTKQDDEDQSDEAQKVARNKEAENQPTPLKLPAYNKIETTSAHGTIAIKPLNGKDSHDENETSLVVRANDKELMSNDEDETTLKQELDKSDMKSDDESDSLLITEAQPKKKRLIRKEGDKLFALEESPDYAEYHEKLSQMRKSQIKV